MFGMEVDRTFFGNKRSKQKLQGKSTTIKLDTTEIHYQGRAN